MRLIYFAVCSAIFIAVMTALHWLMTGISDHFMYGMAVGVFLAFGIGYYAGMTDQKRKQPSADPWESQ